MSLSTRGFVCILRYYCPRKVLKMIFVKSIFLLLTTDFLLTGKGFVLLETSMAAIIPII